MYGIPISCSNFLQSALCSGVTLTYTKMFKQLSLHFQDIASEDILTKVLQESCENFHIQTSNPLKALTHTDFTSQEGSKGT